MSNAGLGSAGTISDALASPPGSAGGAVGAASRQFVGMYDR